MVVSPAESLKRLQQLQAFVKEVMVEGLDYGTIPGTDKPTLLQPGAQKLSEIYGFATSFQDVRCVEDWNTPLFHYEVRCVLTSRRDGTFIGDGLGSCNSKEKRYAGRWAFENDIPPGIAKATLKKKEGKGKKPPHRAYTQYFVPNDDIFSLVNTMKKMACKRALVHAIIGATRSAGLFTQDAEDIPQEAFGKTEDEDKQQEANEAGLFNDIANEIAAATNAEELGRAKMRIVRARNDKSLQPSNIVALIDEGVKRKAELEMGKEIVDQATRQKVLLVDLSSIFRPMWELSKNDIDRTHVAHSTVSRVRQYVADGDYAGVAICCDSPRSWRKEQVPTYKATRPPTEEGMVEQLRSAVAQLRTDGFPIWEADGYEADDLIASAVHNITDPDASDITCDVVIVTADKDLFQLVGDGVTVLSARDGSRIGAQEVRAKMGVPPRLVRDWLCLVGDSSDNIQGVHGIGDKTATELLNTHGSLSAVFTKLASDPASLKLKPAMLEKLQAGIFSAEEAKKLVTLARDIALPWEEIWKPRAPANAAEHMNGGA